MTGRMSKVCQDAKAAGRPAVAMHPHHPCTGCDCACHHIPPPVRHIRNVFAETRDRVRRENTRHIPAQQQPQPDDAATAATAPSEQE